jgi:hypothetical protein
MHSHRSFHNPPALPHAEVVAILERALLDPSQGNESDAAHALVGSALADEDRDFVEHWCIQVGTRAFGSNLRGLCLGHTARRFGRLSPEAIALARSLAKRALGDPADVGSQAISGFEDIEGRFRRPAPSTGYRCGSGCAYLCHDGCADSRRETSSPRINSRPRTWQSPS